MSDFLEFLTSEEMIATYIVVAVLAVLLSVAKTLFSRWKKKHSLLEEGSKRKYRTISLVYMMVKYVLIIGAIISILQIHGVNVTALVAGLGIVSVVIGLAVQDSVKDLLAGLHIVTDSFFEIGDVIDHRGTTGLVIAVSPQTTKIRDDVTGNVLSISNRNIDEVSIVSNFIDIDLSLSYDEDPANIERVFKEEIAPKVAQIENIESCEFKGVQEFADSAVVYRFRFFCPPQVRFDCKRATNRVIFDCLNAAGIEMVYEQLVVHMAKDASASPAEAN